MSLPSATAEAGYLWRLRFQLLRTVVQEGLRQSRLRTLTVLGLTLVFWVLMYVLFADGFKLVNETISHTGTRVQIAHAIFNVFFLALVVMLSISAGIILFGTLHRNREVAYLLTLPISHRRVVLYKFQEAMFFAGWGFLLLGSPLLLAYGRVVEAPWYYYAMLLPFMMAFVCIPCALGAIGCLTVVRFLPRMQLPAVILAATVLLGTLTVVLVVFVREFSTSNMMSIDWFQSMLARLKYSEQRFLPSWWLSTGLLEAAHPATTSARVSWLESVGFFSVLLANALLLYQVVGWCGDHFFLTGLSRVAGRGSRRSVKPFALDRMLAGAFRFLPVSMRQLLIKDFRIFRRDTVQWSQLGIFLGLLVFYFLNIRRLHHGQTYSLWMVSISFLNVAVVALLLATFTTRFIYPLVSLEGRKFWTLGTLPINRGHILWSKFVFAMALTLTPCCLLILLSDHMLQVLQHAPWLALLHQFSCALLCAGLCALAIGLGARLPNLRETSPAKIAAGFGGTLTLVLSVVFIFCMVMATAVPSWFWMRAHPNQIGPQISWNALTQFRLGDEGAILLGLLTTCVVGGIAVWLPIREGIKAFRKMENL
ncbi:MAG: hypothetical protein AAGF97_15995 [Planctomycetota bacterium]